MTKLDANLSAAEYKQAAAVANAGFAAKRKALASMELEAHAQQPPQPQPPPPAGGPLVTPSERRRASKAVHRRRLAERDASRRDWEIRLDADETLEEAMGPRFFGLSADRLAPGDRIVVCGFELAWWCELIVKRSDAVLGAVWTAVLFPRRELVAQDSFDASECLIEQLGSSWRILHGATTIVSDLPSKAAAERWLKRRIDDGNPNA